MLRVLFAKIRQIFFSSPIKSDVKLPDDVKRRAVVYGLDRVDPFYYNGWAGVCPGTILDATRMRDLLLSRGYDVTILLNKAATIAGVRSACEKAVAGMTAGDKLVVYGSSHGGQVRDTDGDEQGGMDSTICLWDGQLVDDEVWRFLIEIPFGVEVDFITDSCNSGTNYRSPHRIAAALSRWNHVSRMPYSSQGLVCSFTHMGGCDDGMSSFGGNDGGVFTNALLSTGPGELTRDQWFNTSADIMPRNQKLVLGSLGPSVLNEKALA